MAGEWREVRLTKVAEIITGQSPPKKTYNERGAVSRSSGARIPIGIRLRQC